MGNFPQRLRALETATGDLYAAEVVPPAEELRQQLNSALAALANGRVEDAATFIQAALPIVDRLDADTQRIVVEYAGLELGARL